MNPLKQQEISDPIVGIYTDLEARLMQNIARHLRDYGELIDSDEWQLRKLAEIGKFNKENIRIIAQMSGQNMTAVQRMLEAASEDVAKNLEPGLSHLARQGIIGAAPEYEKSRAVKQVMRTIKGQAKDTLNLCNTTMLYKARDAFQKLVTDTVNLAHDILNRNTAAAITGAESRQQAIRKTIREFSEKGIAAFVDKRGREWTPEAYVSMSMRTTAGSCATEIQMARCDDYGVDLIEVDRHSGARPKCARDQGKIFDRSNKSTKYPHWNTSSYGEPDGILGINCGHHIYPYIDGVSIRRYFPMTDDELASNDKLYKEIQMQRSLERDVRKQKRECMLYDELGDVDAFEESAVKLKAKEAKLKHYVDQHDNLHRRKDREQVVGFDKRISAEAVSKSQKHYKDWAKSIGAESGPKKLAGYYDLKYNDSKDSRLYKGYVKAVDKGNISPLVGYDKFKEIADEVEKKFVGIHTADGMEIKGYTAHFVDRVIGQQSADSPNRKGIRNGVEFVDIEDALKKPRRISPILEKDNRGKSKVYYGENASVSYNPDTGELIQVQPKRTK